MALTAGQDIEVQIPPDANPDKVITDDNGATLWAPQENIQVFLPSSEYPTTNKEQRQFLEDLRGRRRILVRVIEYDDVGEKWVVSYREALRDNPWKDEVPMMGLPFRTVLIVEDNLNYLRAMKGLLRSDGLSVLVANSLEAGRQLIESTAEESDEFSSIEVAIIDMKLSEENSTEGLQLAKHLRENQPGVRILLMSGSPEIRDKLTKGDEMGLYVHGFIAKPFGPLRLRSELAKVAVVEPGPPTSFLRGFALMPWIEQIRAQDRLEVIAAKAEAQQKVAFSTVHNLRQPVTIIRGELEWIIEAYEKGTLTIETAVEAVQDALKSLKRSENIITGILRSVKPPKLCMTIVELRKVVEPILDKFEKEQKQIEVIVNINPEATIRVDVESLTQVFEELFGNAQRAMDSHGAITVDAFPAELTDDTGKVQSAIQIKVEDDGPGVPPELTNTLFEPFITGTATGTGLGLSFVKNVIKEHGGQIWHEPVKPQGARFVLVLSSISKENTNDDE